MTARSFAGGALALGAGVLAYSALIERNMFGVRREAIDVLEPGCSSIRVLHLSDIHLAPWQHRKIEWIRGLVALRPDLVVVTGDSLGHARAVPELARALSMFKGIPGVFVHGSNDYFAPRIPNPFTYPNLTAMASGSTHTVSTTSTAHSVGWT
jgi:predicted MPP superfamily phosphohydrolase